jgi:alkylation response protein AidB-like acyl-CoA dehydrogenase
MATIERPSASIFTDVHDQLRESIRSFVDREIAPHAASWEETTYPDAIVRRMGELGFLGLSLPEQYGGQGGDYFTNIVLAEEIARGGSGGLLMGLSVHTDMVMPPLLEFGTEEQKQRWLPAGTAGETIFALGITEPDAGSDVSAITTRAVRDGDDWVINGAKTYITNGHRAGMMLTVVKTDPDAGYDGFTTFLIPMDSPGIVLEKPLHKMGMHASDTALIALQDVRVGPEAVLGEVGRGFQQIMAGLDGERLLGAAVGLGIGQRALDDILVYVKERKQFGKPIGSFQALRHRIADLATDLECARLLTYEVAARMEDPSADKKQTTRMTSMAKVKTSETAKKIALEGMQMMGGYGYATEYDMESHVRHSLVLPIYAGTNEVQREIISGSYGLR